MGQVVDIILGVDCMYSEYHGFTVKHKVLRWLRLLIGHFRRMPCVSQPVVIELSFLRSTSIAHQQISTGTTVECNTRCLAQLQIGIAQPKCTRM